MMTFAICEDEPYFSDGLNKMVGQYLKRKNLAATVTIFHSGEELLYSGQLFHLILMDISLPGKNGMETARQLRKNGVLSPIIFITAYQEYVYQDIPKALNRSFISLGQVLLHKPYSNVAMFEGITKRPYDCRTACAYTAVSIIVSLSFFNILGIYLLFYSLGYFGNLR